MKAAMKSDRTRGIRWILGRITNGGTVAIASGTGFSVVRNGAGDVTITLTRPGRRFISASVLTEETTAATGHSAKLIAAPTASAIQVGTYAADATDGAPADVNFSFMIAVSDVAS